MVLPFADVQFCDYRNQEIGEIAIVESAKELRLFAIHRLKENICTSTFASRKFLEMDLAAGLEVACLCQFIHLKILG